MVKAAIEAIKEKFPDQIHGILEHRGQSTVEVKRDKIFEILRLLRDDHGFEALGDLCALDFKQYAGPAKPERFAVNYYLTSFQKSLQLFYWSRLMIPEVCKINRYEDDLRNNIRLSKRSGFDFAAAFVVGNDHAVR